MNSMLVVIRGIKKNISWGDKNPELWKAYRQQSFALLEAPCEQHYRKKKRINISQLYPGN